MSDETAAKPRKRAVLLSNTLVVEVTACEKGADGKPVADPTFEPVTFRVVPFTRAESREYNESESSFKDEKGGWKDQAGWQKVQAERFAARIKSWDILITNGGEIAPINPGTVALLPLFCFGEVEGALFGMAGKIVGNSPACSA